jgi:predicted dehydrogenase
MERYKALLVGAGNMGQAWGKLLAAQLDVELVGWVDLLPDAAARAAATLELNGVWTGTSLTEALAELQPDFVVDVTVPQAHHSVTIASLAAGVPVLGEKPLSDTMEHAREMVAAAQRVGVLYMVSQNRRYTPGLQALRGLIVEELGDLGVLNADFYIGPHFGGFRETMEHPLLLDMAIHTFDAARYLSGADPVAVYCDAFNPPWSWYRGAACATAMFEMSNGLRFTYRGSWCSEGQPTSWEAAWRAVGSNGTATWDGHAAPVADVVVGQDGFLRQTEARHGTLDTVMATGIAGSLQEFLHALRTGTTPMSECHDNIKSLAMVFAAIESATTGQRVVIDL